MTVLIVEDEPRIADFLAKGLTRQGYHVECAYNGSEALRWAGEPNGVAIDLIVPDLGLPDIDGLEVLRALRAADRRSRSSCSPPGPSRATATRRSASARSSV
jgi:DNA-binding response OmpR family regulator